MSGHTNFDVLRQKSQQRRLVDPDLQRDYEREQAAAAVITALGQLREAAEMTQQELAGRLEVSQANISRIERQHDIYLSTLRRYVEALGGRLEVVAVFDQQRRPLALGE